MSLLDLLRAAGELFTGGHAVDDNGEPLVKKYKEASSEAPQKEEPTKGPSSEKLVQKGQGR